MSARGHKWTYEQRLAFRERLAKRCDPPVLPSPRAIQVGNSDEWRLPDGSLVTGLQLAMKGHA